MSNIILRNQKRYIIRLLLILVSSILVFSCANIASPSGGDYDFDPPKIMRSTPLPNQTFVKKGKVEIVFDELVQIDKPMEKVIITPPQKNFPLVQAQNNKVIVELKDTLKVNTTYTIDFTDAIVDNNEQNPLENFALSFSTGDAVDTLSISGKVLAADNLEPVSGIYVGIYSNLSDTAFTKTPFLRISRTNDLGMFSIKGVAAGKYKIYALDDRNRDYMYDSPTEALAFSDSVIVPATAPDVRYDSVFNAKTLAFDSLKEVRFTKFLPDDVVLRSFLSAFKRKYLQKHERPSDDVLSVYFGAATQFPKIEALNTPSAISQWSLLERTAGNDTLKYWITEPDIAAIDTILLKVSYNKTDSLNQLQWVSDTLKFVNRKKATKKDDDKKKDKKNGKEKIQFLSITTDIKSDFDIYKDINIEFSYPIVDLDEKTMSLSQQMDSTSRPLKYALVKDSLNPRKYKIKYKWEHDGDYTLHIDSSAIYSYNGLWNDQMDVSFKVKALDQYGTLRVNIDGLLDNMPAFVQLLDKADNPVYRADVEKGVVNFSYLDPGVYYARIVLDANGNGQWDTGEYLENRQPETVYYYNKTFEIKAFWDIEEDWTIDALPLDRQKPLEITKNKPKDNDKKRKDMERRDSQAKKRREEQNNRNNNGQFGNRRNPNSNNNGYSY